MRKEINHGAAMLWSALALLAVPTAALTYWAFIDDLMPVTEQVLADQVATDDNPRDAVGRRRTSSRENLQVKRRLCSRREVSASVHRTMTDGVVYTIPDATTTVRVGCNTRTGQVPVPTSLPPNVWFRYDVMLRRCNPVRCAELRLLPY